MEMIAVMAIIAILASAIAPNIASQLKRARSDAEDATLANISRLLTESVIRTHTIPGSGTWTTDLAALSDLPANQIATNEDNFPRVFLVDPAWNPSATLPPAGGWTQTPANAWLLNGASGNCRILLISGTQQDLTASCGSLSAIQFDQVWNNQGGPSACMQSNDARVSRTNLTPLFHQATIVSSAGAGSFTFDDSIGYRQVFGAGSRTFLILSGTRLSLLNAAGDASLTEIVANRSVSAIWNGTDWTVP